MINPQNRNLSELNTCFFSSFDRLPHRVSHINFNLYHYAGNNPVKYLDPDGKQVKIHIPRDFSIEIKIDRDQLDALGSAIQYEYDHRTIGAKIADFFNAGNSIDKANKIFDTVMDIFDCASMVFEELGPIANAKTLFEMAFPDTVAETYHNFNKFYHGKCFNGKNEVSDIKMTIVQTTIKKTVATGTGPCVVVTTTTTTTLSAKVNGKTEKQELKKEETVITYPNCRLIGE